MAKGLDYLHLRAWCAMMGSFDYYLRGELELARADKAPEDVTFSTRASYFGERDLADEAHFFRGPEGRVWARYRAEELSPETVAQMERYLANLRATGRVHG